MTIKNKYFTRSRLSEKKFREIIKLFSADLDSLSNSFFDTNRNTIHKILKNIRVRICEICEKESPFEKGEMEMDESYFGAKRIRQITKQAVRKIQEDFCDYITLIGKVILYYRHFKTLLNSCLKTFQHNSKSFFFSVSLCLESQIP